MRITDELREWMYGHTVNCSDNRIALAAIAGRIDAEHEKAVNAFERDMGMEPMTDENMAKHGWIRLPVDADGVPIHVGDKMEWCDPDGEVTVTCYADAVGVGCFFAWDGANGRYAQKCANAYHHHHEPTVEDVLREFANECLTYATCVDDHEVADAIELYAAKLRLAGDDE